MLIIEKVKSEDMYSYYILIQIESPKQTNNKIFMFLKWLWTLCKVVKLYYETVTFHQRVFLHKKGVFCVCVCVLDFPYLQIDHQSISA